MKPSPSRVTEKLVSGIGGAIGLMLVFAVTLFIEQWLHISILLIASMGASAVLLFATPHSPLAQPWNVIGGHVISALIGVSVYFVYPNIVIGGALAVGLAISAMYFLRCIHPPGGATAVIPFLAGAVVDKIGYLFVVVPVGLSAAAMVIFAIAYNYPFKWRRYPLTLSADDEHNMPDSYPDISHADLVTALSEIDTFVDISEQDLLRIYEIACRRAHPALESDEEKARQT